jgi:hypothetical protein
MNCLKMKLIIENSDVSEDGTIDHIDVSNYDEINCVKCTRLKELPLWTNILIIVCNKCELLTKLPLWPNVIFVDCHNCISLTELPLWPKINDIMCSDCPVRLKRKMGLRANHH